MRGHDAIRSLKLYTRRWLATLRVLGPLVLSGIIPDNLGLSLVKIYCFISQARQPAPEFCPFPSDYFSEKTGGKMMMIGMLSMLLLLGLEAVFLPEATLPRGSLL